MSNKGFEEKEGKRQIRYIFIPWLVQRLTYKPLQVAEMATALLDRLLHHAVVLTINSNSYRLRVHTDLVPEHIRTKMSLTPPPPPKKRGCPKMKKGGEKY